MYINSKIVVFGLVMFSFPLCTASNSTKPQPISITGASPFFLVSKAVMQKQVMSSSVINNCHIKSFTSCPKANLANKYIQGAFLSFANLLYTDLSGSNLMLGTLSFTNSVGVNLSDSNISGIGMNNSDFRYANMKGLMAATVAAGGADLRYADLSNSNFYSASLTGTKFQFAKFRNAILTGNSLSHGSFVRA